MTDDKNIHGKPGQFSYKAGDKKSYLIWWVLGVAVQIALMLPIVIKRLSWKGLLITSLVFLPLMYIVESIGLYWGWWVWNESQLWGIKIGLVPLEEFLLYFLVVPSVVIIQTAVYMVKMKLKAHSQH